GFAIRNLKRLVHRRSLQIAGNAAVADTFRDGAALDDGFAATQLAVETGTDRIGEGDRDRGFALLQRHGNAGQGTTGTGSAHEAIDSPGGLLPDLGAGSLVVDTPVGHVVELIGPYHAVLFRRGEFLRQMLGDVHIILR